MILRFLRGIVDRPRWVLAINLVLVGLGFSLDLAPVAKADVFTQCPDGHEGVVGGHTSCGFAQNIRDGYFRFGTHFNAYSPATNTWYQVDCDPHVKTAYFEGGGSQLSVNCYAGDGAEVVVW